MQIDFRKRCVKDMVIDGVDCQIIRYGATAEETGSDWCDVEERYADLGMGGRQAGMFAEVGVTRYFYTPGMRDEQARNAQKGRIRR